MIAIARNKSECFICHVLHVGYNLRNENELKAISESVRYNRQTIASVI